MRKFVAAFFVLMVTFAPMVALAVQPDEIMSDPAQEARARALSRELRCMVCQNQSIDDSDAPLARDLRLLVREQIAAGKNDQQVMDFLVDRYGEFVLLKPRVEGHTLILWLVSPLLLIGGGAALWLYNRRRNQTANQQPSGAVELTPDEKARLDRLMSADSSEERSV
jgi:cytochrome c-type biogenesis protein CcmH